MALERSVVVEVQTDVEDHWVDPYILATPSRQLEAADDTHPFPVSRHDSRDTFLA